MSIVRGARQKIRGRRKYSHGYTIKRKKYPSSPLFLFFYTTSHSFMLESQSWAQG
jgi:hypothetical protein